MACVALIWYPISAMLLSAQDRVFVKIINVANGKVLDGTPRPRADENSVRQSEWRGSAGQLWALRSVGGTNGEFHYIVNRLTGRWLEPMLPCDHDDLCPIRQAEGASETQQQWQISSTPDGRRRLINRKTAKLLYVQDTAAKAARDSRQTAGSTQRWTYSIVDIVGPSADSPNGGGLAPYVAR